MNQYPKTSKRAVQSLLAALLALGTLTVPAYAQLYQLTDGQGASYTKAEVDVASDRMMYNWVVGGQDQLKTQTFFFRVGSEAQRSLSSADSISVSAPSNNVLNAVFNFSDVSIAVGYSLYGVGAGVADIQESITVHNHTGRTIDNFHLYQYSDYDLYGSAVDNEIRVDNGSAYQTYGDGSLSLQETITNPKATSFEANTLSGNGGFDPILARLRGSQPVNLENLDYAIGDVTWAFEWAVSIESGKDLLVLKDRYACSSPIPEPSALAFLTLGLGLLGWAKRR